MGAPLLTLTPSTNMSTWGRSRPCSSRSRRSSWGSRPPDRRAPRRGCRRESRPRTARRRSGEALRAGAAARSRDLGNPHGEHVGKVAGDQRPGVALVPARIHLAKPGAEVDARRVSASRRPSRREAPPRSTGPWEVPSRAAPSSRRRSRSGTRAALPPEETARHQPGAGRSRAYRVGADGRRARIRSCSAARISIGIQESPRSSLR